MTVKSLIKQLQRLPPDEQVAALWVTPSTIEDWGLRDDLTPAKRERAIERLADWLADGPTNESFANDISEACDASGDEEED